MADILTGLKTAGAVLEGTKKAVEKEDDVASGSEGLAQAATETAAEVTAAIPTGTDETATPEMTTTETATQPADTTDYKKLYEDLKKQYEERFTTATDTLGQQTETEIKTGDERANSGTYEGLFGSLKEGYDSKARLERQRQRDTARRAVQSGNYNDVFSVATQYSEAAKPTTEAIGDTFDSLFENVTEAERNRNF